MGMSTRVAPAGMVAMPESGAKSMPFWARATWVVMTVGRGGAVRA